MIDTHTHIYMEEFDADRDEVVARATAAGIGTMILPNVDSTTITALHRTLEAYPGRCHAAMGLHPTSVTEHYEQDLEEVRRLLESRRYCAIGEIGIDLYWDKTFRSEQATAFDRQVSWAEELSLPIIIHCREALDDILEVLSRRRPDAVRGVFHSFTGTPCDVARIRRVAGDVYFGINGIVTFKNAHLDETVASIGRDRLLLETDAPYLAPVPYRGRRNEPSYTAYVAARIASLWDTSIEEVDAVTTANARRLFAI